MGTDETKKWNDTKQARLNELRAREDVLTESEHQELQALILEIEQDEWNYLQPGFAHRQMEQAELETWAKDLAAEKQQLTEILVGQRVLHGMFRGTNGVEKVDSGPVSALT